MPDSPPPPKHPRLHAFLRHPASLLVWFTLFSVLVREQYPVSHFPMYSGFEDKTWYIYFQTADGQPLQTKRVFKNTCARSKKRYGSLAREYMKEIGKEDDRPNAAEHEVIGARLIEEYKRNAPAKVRKKREFDAVFNGEVTLVRVEINFEDGEFTTTEQKIATR
jgi:hypothetical protein